MYCIFILFLSIVLSEVNSQSIERKVRLYFRSDANRNLRKQWDNHRKSLENAISLSMRETIGFGGMNVYIRKTKGKLASGFYHNDNQVRLILKDMELQDLPTCWMPDVQFSLASNLLKIEASLSKMIIYAEYSVIRNKSDIIYEIKDQDPYKTSPFLFQQVQDAGEVTISMDDCLLSGFILTTLSGDSINLGYHSFEILNCQYTLEIYIPGEGSPPVIAKYSPYRDDGGLHISHLLMNPIEDELIPKLQACMFSYVNTSAVFGMDFSYFQKNQENLFYETSQYLAEVVRNLNKIMIEKFNGAIEMKDYQVHWDDGKPHHNASKKGEVLMLTDMVLTGLDSLYSAHIGGPYKEVIPMIGEEIRFSSLQVRGHLQLQSAMSDPKGTDNYGFAVEISDVAVDLHLSVYIDPTTAKRVEVKRFRTMSVTVPSVIFGSAAALIQGYLQNEVPKLLKARIQRYIPEALNKRKGKVREGKEHGKNLGAEAEHRGDRV